MNQYHEYSLEDFVLDARFQEWVRYRRDHDVTFWEQYQKENPAQTEEITRAQTLLQSVYKNYETHLDDNEIDFEIQELLSKVRAMKNDNVQEETEKSLFNKSANIFSQNSIFWAAATILLMLGLGWLYQRNQITQSSYDKLTAGKSLREEKNETKSSKTISLSDGSQITLMPHSKISFPENFLVEKREVYLSGQAFFHVSKDPKRPFLVYANELVTKVLGTSFTINAQNQALKTTVEVKEGKVSVFRQADFADVKNQKALQSKGMVLTANQKMVYECETSNMLKTIIDNPEIVSTVSTTFDFVNTPASEVLNDLEDAYQVDIIFDKELLRGCPVTASLSKQSLLEKLDIICEVIEARYEMLDGKIVVYSKGCKN
ncbi:FecR family protein [Dyadobacter frigoris]|uniref:FecR family protein n=1 Tax=Dyadobacter frigoris TaxID=2576211 RepID=A0A4U6D613_9BACT|nr:FecR family protein [Dyadobacter frigoris]TKT92820.1 FecR family protein [Dyadobacter frigoris]GLU54416.1 anti-sigma factor [Dyadobacter frigoris]